MVYGGRCLTVTIAPQSRIPMTAPDRISTALALAREVRDLLPEADRMRWQKERIRPARDPDIERETHERADTLFRHVAAHFPSDLEAGDVEVAEPFFKGTAAPVLEDEDAYRALPDRIAPLIILRRLVYHEASLLSVVKAMDNPQIRDYMKAMKPIIFR